MKSVARTLETDRLTLRVPDAADLPAYTAYCGSNRSAFVGGPFDPAKAFEKFCAMSGHWSLRGFGRYVICMDGHAIGHVGPLQMDQTVAPELTWTLWDGAAEGQGYASEAATAVWTHLAETCGWQAMIIRIMPDNIRSCRIAERLGAVLSRDPAPAWYPGALTYHLRGAAA